MFSKSFLPGKLWWWDNRVGDTAQWVPTNPFLHSLLLRERAESRERGMRREMEGTIKGCYASVFRSDVISPKKIKFPSVEYDFNKEKHKSWAASTETETSMLLKRNMKGYLRSIKNRIKYINWMMLTQSFKKIFSSFDIYIYGLHTVLLAHMQYYLGDCSCACSSYRSTPIKLSTHFAKQKYPLSYHFHISSSFRFTFLVNAETSFKTSLLSRVIWEFLISWKFSTNFPPVRTGPTTLTEYWIMGWVPNLRIHFDIYNMLAHF